VIFNLLLKKPNQTSNILEDSMKNINSAARSHFLKSCLLPLPYLFILGFIGGYVFKGIPGAILGSLAAIFLSIIVGSISQLVANTVGGSASGLLYGGGKSTFSLRQRLEGDLQQVRYNKMNNNFDKALELIDGVLSQDPDFPEALFLKAQVLWEGFKDSDRAKVCLEHLIKIVPDEEAPLNRWSNHLLSKINQ